MPLKSKTISSKIENTQDKPDLPEKEEEIKSSEAEVEEKTEVTKVPSWRAEVVEEGVEETPPESSDAGKETTKDETSSQTPSNTAVEDETTEKDLGEVKPESDTSTLDLTMPQEPQEGKGKKIFIIVFVLVLVAGLIAGGLFYYKSRVSSSDESQTEGGAIPTPTTSEASTPTPTVEVKMGDYKVSILNGSGIVGEANKVKVLLTKEGFKEVTTGNAESYNFTISEISLKKDTPDPVYQAVKKALADYKIIRQEKSLEDTSEADIQIIIGSTKAETTPTPSQ